ncbi:MAG: hypothetical protein M1827_004581 [Pycnora praestabilis]|nr:MAG: hypothetical protein M1827_004581 [Pycnora praestabilis]
MSTVTKISPPSSIFDRRTSMNPPVSSASSSWGPSRSPTATPVNGVTKTRSIRGSSGTPVSARAAIKRPGACVSNLSTSNLSMTSPDIDQNDAKAETAALIENLNSRLRRAETASEEYQHQLRLLQRGFDDAQQEQAKMEERVHESEVRVESSETEHRESLRQAKAMKDQFEEERVVIMREKEEQSMKEVELQSVIQRLKETLAQREMRATLDDKGRSSRTSSIRSSSSPNLDNDHFAPPPSLNRSNSTNNSKLIHQKDGIIESLRLEIADAQIRLVEMENGGGGRLQELEKLVLETRMTNTRLMEDNESFQLLLGEKTLHGDFSRIDFMQRTATHMEERSSFEAGAMSSSLADELECANEGESENYRRLEMEAKSLKDQNKALSLYINSIIERLLNHKDCEAILDKTPGLMSGPNAASVKHADPVVSNDDRPLPPLPTEDAAPSTFLQRAKSVAMGNNRPRPRPMSMMPPPPSAPIIPDPHDEVPTAPSKTLSRSRSLRSTAGHKRANSEWSHARVVNNMYRGSQANTTTPDQISPGVIPNPRQTSFFSPLHNPGNPNAAARIPSGTLVPSERVGSSSNSILSDNSGEVADAPSPPRSQGGSSNSTGGSVVAGNKLRPLRLVQENVQMESGDGGSGRKGDMFVDDDAAKKAKRGSWMGWFNKGKEQMPPGSVSGEPI